MLSQEDKSQIAEFGIDEKTVLGHVEAFKKGFPYVQLLRPCTPGDGIEKIEQQDKYRSVYREESRKGRASIFVPASGAASRMFKALESIYNRDAENPQRKLREIENDPGAKAAAEFMQSLKQFAFYGALQESLKKAGMDLESLCREGSYVPVFKYFLKKEGLNYASLPKGLVAFHREGGKVKTPFEEHLIEASLYLKDDEGKVRIHFTVPLEFEETIRRHIDEKKTGYEALGIHFDLTYSRQKPSTDTVAVDLQNNLFRDSKGRLVFRPGGHGALLENLNELKGDIVFIKNIDNILPDRSKKETVRYQELLGGYLIEKQRLIFRYLKGITQSSASNLLDEACAFVEAELGAKPEGGRREWAVRMLNRPVRVCGMVKNEGEPGGGPFWIHSAQGAVSKQIVEKSQVNVKEAEQNRILNSATHFNPVNLVCGLKDHEGRPFDLKQYVDPQTGFISTKSKEGRDLKALELPGLWNGAMAEWITFFLEVPVETFGPVKEVNDLLRDKHQSGEPAHE